MKLSVNCILLVLFISIRVVGQEVILPLSDKTTDSAKLSYTTEITEQKYCSASKLFLRLRSTFKNVGTMPVILDRESKIDYKWKIKRISGKMKRNYEATIAPYFELGDEVRWGQVPKEELFVVLKPNETYSYITAGGLHVDLDDGQKISRNGIRAGQYTVQFRIMTWYYSYPLIDEYRQKWQDKGFLWSNDIVSEPMPFEVREKFLTVKCEIQ